MLALVSFCCVNTANPGSARVKCKSLPGVGLTGRIQARLEKDRVNTNLGRTRVGFDFAHTRSCVQPSNFAALGKLRMVSSSQVCVYMRFGYLSV